MEAHTNASGIRGAVTYRDLAADLHFRSTEITSVASGEDNATITGMGEANGQTVSFIVTVHEAERDLFSIVLSNGYEITSPLRSGNIIIDNRCA